MGSRRRDGRTDTRPKAPHDLTPRRTRKPRPYNVKARAPAHCTGVLQACQVSHLSALSTAPCSTPERVSPMSSTGRAVSRVGRSGWSVRQGQHGVPPLHRNEQLGHGCPGSTSCTCRGRRCRTAAVRDSKRHRTRWRQQLAARRCSWWLRALHRRRELLKMHAWWLRRLRVWALLIPETGVARAPKPVPCWSAQARSAGRPPSWFGWWDWVLGLARAPRAGLQLGWCSRRDPRALDWIVHRWLWWAWCGAAAWLDSLWDGRAGRCGWIWMDMDGWDASATSAFG